MNFVVRMKGTVHKDDDVNIENGCMIIRVDQCKKLKRVNCTVWQVCKKVHVKWANWKSFREYRVPSTRFKCCRSINLTIIFKGPSASKKISLMKLDEYYHGCTPFGVFESLVLLLRM